MLASNRRLSAVGSRMSKKGRSGRLIISELEHKLTDEVIDAEENGASASNHRHTRSDAREQTSGTTFREDAAKCHEEVAGSEGIVGLTEEKIRSFKADNLVQLRMS